MFKSAPQHSTMGAKKLISWGKNIHVYIFDNEFNTHRELIWIEYMYIQANQLLVWMLFQIKLLPDSNSESFQCQIITRFATHVSKYRDLSESIALVDYRWM